MVQTDISQFTRECNGWRETLHSFRDELRNMQFALEKAVSHPLSKEEQSQLEHLQNQLHIQLINIHDLKQSVKFYDRNLQSEVSQNTNHFFTDDISAFHENLYDDYHMLETALDDLREDFSCFMNIVQ
jgi:hypothetical protein